MIVVDTSVMVPAFIEAPDSEAARRIVTPKARWVVSPLWQFEFTSAMVTLIRAGEVDQATAHKAFDNARTTVINRELPVDQGQVMRLAIRLKISAYDAQYVALAEEYGGVCVTADEALCEKAPTLAVLLRDFLRQL